MIVAPLNVEHLNIIPTLGNSFLPLSNLACQLVVVGTQQVASVAQFVIELAVVVVKLPLHCIVRRNLCDAVLDNANPSFAVALGVPVVIKRHNLVFEQTIDGSSIQLVLIFLIGICALVGQRPTCTLAIAFIPPAVHDRKIHNAVHQCFLARRTACLERSCRRVHPDVHATHQTASQLHVVILEEDNLAQELRALADFVDVLNEALTCAVCRMSLSCVEELHGVLRVIDYLLQTLQICEQQVCTLVSGETTAETYQQCIRIDFFHERHHAARVALILQPAVAELLANVVHQFCLQLHSGFPHFGIAYIVYSFPNLLVALVGEMCLVEVLGIEFSPLVGAPCGEVHAVGNIAHMTFLGIIAIPDAGKHLLAHFAMQPAHAVHFLRSIASEGGHAEAFAFILGIHAAHADELVVRNSKLRSISAHVLREEALVEIIVAGRHWRMNGV